MKKVKVIGVGLLLFTLSFLNAQMFYGGFESSEPNYFSTAGTSATADITWSMDEYRTGMHSLGIMKPDADGTASWISDDIARYWQVNSGPDVAVYYGAWVKLDGVNIDPMDDSEKVQLIFTFMDNDGTDLLGEPLILDIPQDAATTEWMEIIAPFPLSFPVNVADIFVEFKFGENATGNGYLDDLFLRAATDGEWAGSLFNNNVDLPDGWFTWFSSNTAGKAEWSDDMPQSGWQTADFARTGASSLRMDKYVEETELVVISDPVDFFNDGSPLIFSGYYKTELPEGMADLANADPSYAMGITVTWHDGTCGADGWGEVGGVDYRFNVAGDNADWTRFEAVFTPPDNATQFSFRTRYWHFFQGTTYWDDLEVVRATDIVDPFGGDFESAEPNYFNAGGTSATADVNWSMDEYRTGMHSLGITKPNTDGTAVWSSDDIGRYWQVNSGPDVAVYYGAWVKLDGVNVDPMDDSEKIQLIYHFMDNDGTDLLGEPLVLDIPQDAATTEWMEVIAPFPLSFPVNVADIFVEFKFGENATGSGYVDDWFLRNAVDGEWAGSIFNNNVDLPDGWFTWFSSNTAGKAEWTDDMPQSGWQTQEFAYTGASSLRMDKYVEETELVVISDPVDFVNNGAPLLVSAMVKTNLPEGMADMANADPSYAMGITLTWHDGTCGEDGWGEVGGTDYRFTVTGDDADWTEYTALMYPPDNATQYSLRTRYWHFFQGTTYWDNITVTQTTGDIEFYDYNLPNAGFEGDEPNYFNAGGGTSETAMTLWSTDEYRTGMHSIGIDKPNADGTAFWASDDIARYWQVNSGPDVAVYYGAWVKLDGVNIDPADDTEKIQLVFHFMDDDGTDLLGEPLILDVPQDAATTEWMEVIAPFPLSFPVNVADIFVEFKFGENATGMGYVDDWFLRNAVDGEWAGSIFNCNLDLPDGWFTWFSSNTAGKAEWTDNMPQSGWQTQEYAHSGASSLRIEKYVEETEVVVNSDPYDFENIGVPLVFSAWVKFDLPEGMADMANTDPAYAAGFTVTWHDGTCGEDGWGEVGGSDYRFTTIPGDDADWTYFEAVLNPPDNATQYSLRARNWHFFQGTTYWDDFAVDNYEYVYGDGNVDGQIDVLDIVAIVAQILSTGDLGEPGYTNADFNFDGNVDILDIVAIVELILSGRHENATSATLVADMDGASLNANGFVGGVQLTITHGADFRITPATSAMVADYRTIGNETVLLVVAPENGLLFAAEGEYTITEAVVATSDGYIDVGFNQSIPEEFSIAPAYPNPFNPVVNIGFNVPVEGHVKVAIHDLMGREVTTLVNDVVAQGYQNMVWNATNAGGTTVASGVYFINVTYNNDAPIVQKVMFLK